MKLIKTLLIVCIAMALQITANASPSSGKKIKLSGDIVTKTFDIPSSSYTKIDVSTIASVKIVEGSGDIVVKIDSNLESYFVVEVSGDKLRIRLDDDVKIEGGNLKFEVRVPCNSELNEISASGVVSVVSEVALTGDDIRISAEGVCIITAIAEGGDCYVEALGVSKVDLECNVETLEVEAEGTCRVIVEGVADHAELSADGISSVSAKGLEYETIEVEKSGLSRVKYRRK